MNPNDRAQRLRELLQRLRAARQYAESHRDRHVAISHPVTSLWCDPELYALLERLAPREIRDLNVKLLHAAQQNRSTEEEKE